MSEANSTDFTRQLELAWAAGFFDGEGCTSLDVQRRGYCYPRLSIKQVVRENLERFLRAVGGVGGVRGPRQENPRGKPICRYRVCGNGAREVLKLLWPYLGEAKREQAERVLAAESRKWRLPPRERATCPHGHPYDGVTPNGWRKCKTCDAQRQRESRRAARLKREAEPCPPTGDRAS